MLGAARPPTSDHDIKLPCRTEATDKLPAGMPAGISPAVKGMLYKARVRREQGVGAYLLNTADVY